MSETSGQFGAANSTSRPDPAAGDMPRESELPSMHGLDSAVVSGREDEVAAGADLADDIGSISSSSSATGTPGSSSDPMPDTAGTGGS